MSTTVFPSMQRIVETLKRLISTTSPGPWVREGFYVSEAEGDRFGICIMDGPLEQRDTDADFIVACRTALPQLLDVIEATQRGLQREAARFHDTSDQRQQWRARDIGDILTTWANNLEQYRTDYL